MSLGSDYFDALYAAAEDPWSMRTRWYERRKYALTVAALPRQRYADGLEVGCSVGELTALLAPRCERLVAWDASAAAVAATRARTGARTGGAVQVRHAAAPRTPLTSCDLLVLSEVLYYLDPDDLGLLLEQLPDAVRAGGTVVAVHWRHPVADYPQGGDAVHAALRTALRNWPRVAAHEEPDFLLDVWVAGSGSAGSVAAAEGLL